MRHLKSECDNCGRLLQGPNKGAFTDIDHLCLRGVLSVQFGATKGSSHDHAFVTYRPDQDHHFCDGVCLNEFIETRKAQYLARKKREQEKTFREETNRYK